MTTAATKRMCELKAGDVVRIVKFKYDPISMVNGLVPPVEDDWLSIVADYSKTGGSILSCGVDKAGKPVSRISSYAAHHEVEKLTLSEKSLEEWQKRGRAELASNAAIFLAKGYGPSGSDPEIFVRGGDGEIMPAWTFLPDKKNPLLHKNASSATWTSAFYDGYQAEFTLPANGCHDNLMRTIQHGLQAVLNEAQKKDPKAHLDWTPYVEIPPGIMSKQTTEHNGLGCSPSKSAYGEEALKVDDPSQLAARFTGCHMHFGWSSVMGSKPAANVVKRMDAIYGIVATSLLDGIDNPRRRLFYGKAGEYRTPKHGLEYRTPSSAILAHPVLTYLNFDLARLVGYDYLGGNLLSGWAVPGGEDQVREVINSGDAKTARKIIGINIKLLTAVLNKLYREEHKKVVSLIEGGAVNFLPLRVKDFQTNWTSPRFTQVYNWKMKTGTATT